MCSRPMASRRATSTTTAIWTFMSWAARPPRHYLYINDGAGHFTEEALARGAAVATGAGDTESSRHGSWPSATTTATAIWT